jgi:cyclopropane fatty-acyl-phospholipid synthase-like methyltransferase
MDKTYLKIVEHYEKCLETYGDSDLGVDWTRPEQVKIRHRVMLEAIRQAPGGAYTLLDLGCGCAHLYEYIVSNGISDIAYSGLDISEKYISVSRSKFPHIKFYQADILVDKDAIPEFDYIIMNGVFNEKRELTFDEMFAYFRSMIRAAFSKSKTGIAFNVMTKYVDWEREDLFHLPFNLLAEFLSTEVSRHFLIRHDYGLFEYSVYVYKEPA